MQKGSNNRNKQRLKVARLHEKVSNQRKDFLHKQSRQITNAYDCVCIEDLDMKAMSRLLNFGKSGNHPCSAQAVGFRQGKKLVKVGRFFTSSKPVLFVVTKMQKRKILR